MSKERASRRGEGGPALRPSYLTVVADAPEPTVPDARIPPTEIVLGEVIAGTRYRAIDRLGEGGMGVVYLAEHVDIERMVALKILHADFVSNPLVLRQFRQEARAASRIGSAYVCDVTDWG